MPIGSLFSFDGQMTGIEIPDNLTSPLNPTKVMSPDVIIWGDRVFIGDGDGFHEAVAWTVPTHGGQGGTGVNSQPQTGKVPLNNPVHTADGTVYEADGRPIGDPNLEKDSGPNVSGKPNVGTPISPATGTPGPNNPNTNKSSAEAPVHTTTKTK